MSTIQLLKAAQIGVPSFLLSIGGFYLHKKRSEYL